MRSPECGAHGYSRKTMTPEWRCSRRSCGYLWDATVLPSEEVPYEELMEQLEAFRHDADRRVEERSLQDKYSSRGAVFAFSGLFIGLFIGRQLTGTEIGSICGGILLGFPAWMVGRYWNDWIS